MRTVYLGTSDFAVTVLERLAESDHRPDLVVTRPDRPRGRGRTLSSPPVADAARSLDIELLQPDSVNSDGARAAIANALPDAVCVCAYGALIREPLLSEYLILNYTLNASIVGAVPNEMLVDYVRVWTPAT